MAVQLKLSTTNGVPVLKDMGRLFPTDDEQKSYITEAAAKRGIDPQTALEVWTREGRTSWQSKASRNGIREPSYGPYQLLVGGKGTGYPGGLGNEFKDRTGLDPSDPKNWKATVDFALDTAKAKGWGQWYGARAAGIRGMEGIGGNPSAFTASAFSPPKSGTPSTPTGTAPVAKAPIPPRSFPYGGTSEAISPSSILQMAPQFASQLSGRSIPDPSYEEAGVPEFGDLTGQGSEIASIVDSLTNSSLRRKFGGV